MDRWNIGLKEVYPREGDISALAMNLNDRSTYCFYEDYTGAIWVSDNGLSEPQKFDTWEDVDEFITKGFVADDNDHPIYYDAAVELMNWDICEELHGDLAPCTDQEFYDAYCKAHLAKFGEPFVVN